MGVRDRLRAKMPPEGDERWEKCELKELLEDTAIVIDEGQEIELELTEELVDLFESRNEGKEAWYIKK